MFDKDKIKSIIDKAFEEKGRDLVELYGERVSSCSIRCEDDKIERISTGVNMGCGLRMICGEQIFYGSTYSCDYQSISDILEGFGELLHKTEKVESSNYGSKVDSPASLHKIELNPDKVPVEEKIDLVRKANRTCREFDKERIKQVQVSYVDGIKKISIYNPILGGIVEEDRTYVTFIINVVAQDGNIVQTGYEPMGGLIGFELFKRHDVLSLARIACERAVRMLEAKQAPAGQMPVVIASNAGGTMIHEAIGHSLEADLVQKDVSPAYKGKRNQSVASKLITVIDDPTMPNRRGSYIYDDEGTPGQKTVLVEEGILKNYLYDRFAANKDKTQSTGNGRRESYSHRPIPRMSNTYIAKGKSDPGEIIASTQSGLYVKKMGGGQVNTATGDFVFDVAEGYLIEKGKIGRMVKGATLVGNGPEVLKSVDRVGSDLGFSIGTCGKDGQGVPVSDGQPTIRIPAIIVGGTKT